MRYHGGKWQLAEWIIGHFPPHRSYCEPFGGAGSVLLRKARAHQECWNDLNGEIVNVFRVLRDPIAAVELERLVRMTPFARAEFEATYAESDEPIERARKTIARSFMGFGSASANHQHATGFRAKSNRSGTTPAQDWRNWPAEISRFTERFTGVVIESRPALEVIQQQDEPNTLFYIDPPYPWSTRGNHNGVRQKYRHEMSDEDHHALAEVLHQISGMAVLSGYPCDLYDLELYGDWHRVQKETYADGARPRTEVIWVNPAAWRALKASQAQTCLLDMAAT